jgi:hypothetical protein
MQRVFIRINFNNKLYYLYEYLIFPAGDNLFN